MFRRAGRFAVSAVRLALRIVMKEKVLECALALVAVLFVFFAVSSMTSRLMAMPRYEVDLTKLAMRSGSGAHALRYPWISRSIKRDLLELAKEHPRMCLLDPETCALIARKLDKNPWVGKVVEVGPVYPASIRWQVTYHLPAAFVEVGRKYVLVAADGRRLPVTYTRRPPGRHNLYILSGLAPETSLPPVGGKFKHPGVDAGIRTIEAVGKIDRILRRRGDGVRFIDIKDGGRNTVSEINIMTRSRAMIEWGRPSALPRGTRSSIQNLKEGIEVMSPLPLRSRAAKLRSLKDILLKEKRLRAGWTYRLWTPVAAAEPVCP